MFSVVNIDLEIPRFIDYAQISPWTHIDYPKTHIALSKSQSFY
jgi:hypothetical protein